MSTDDTKPKRDNYSERASRGQALNLAVQEAIALDNSANINDKHIDLSNCHTKNNRFLLERFIHYYELSNLVQEATIEEIKEELK